MGNDNDRHGHPLDMASFQRHPASERPMQEWSSPSDSTKMLVLEHQILLSVCLFTVAMVGAVVPQMLVAFCGKRHPRTESQPQRRAQQLLQISNSSPILACFQGFAGGSLLALIVIQLLPETFATTLSGGSDLRGTSAGIVVMAGVLLVLWMDRFVHLTAERCSSAGRKRNGSLLNVCNGLNVKPVIGDSAAVVSEIPLLDEDDDDDGEEEDLLLALQNVVASRSSKPIASSTCEALMSSLTLTAAISLHSLLEGVTLALQGTSVSALWMLGASLMSHKWVVAMSLAAALQQRAQLKPLIKLIVVSIFALMAPLGCIITSFVFTDHKNLASDVGASIGAVVQALAIGSLIYIDVFELLLPVVTTKQSGATVAAFLTLGVTVVMILQGLSFER